MKKIVSILLILTMLASMAMAAIPAFAAQVVPSPIDPTTVGNNVVTALDREDYVDELIEKDYLPISSAADLKNVESNKSYYLTTDIIVTTHSNGPKTVENITIDGCGYTMTLSNPVFDSPKNVTFENITFEGTLNSGTGWVGCIAARWSYNGYFVGRNITISDSFTITTKTADRLKNLSILVGQANADKESVFENIYNGGKIKWLPDSSAKQGQQIEQFGGLVGIATNATFNKVVCAGAIQIGDGTTDMYIRLRKFDGSGNNGGIGGILGQAGDNVTFTDCLNTGSIVINDKVHLQDLKNIEVKGDVTVGEGEEGFTWGSTPYKNVKTTVGNSEFGGIGGIIGAVRSRATTLTNCHNLGAILLKNDNAVELTSEYGTGTAHRALNVGGIVGYGNGSGKLTMTACSNTAAITLEKARANGIGGIMGKVEGDLTVTLDNCDNSAAITAALGQKEDLGLGMGGVVGVSRTNNISILNCDNSGELSYTVYAGPAYSNDASKTIHTGTAGVGGIFGYQYKTNATYLEVRNCHNTGSLTDSEDSTRGVFVGGVVGGIRGVKTTVIYECTNNQSVSSTSSVGWASAGGIVGHYASVGNWMSNNNADIEAILEIRMCKNTGNITAGFEVGGIIGDNHEISAKNLVTNIYGCTNEGKITATTHKSAGGIYGNCDLIGTLNMQYCVNKGEVVGAHQDASVGGIVSTIETSLTALNIKNCMNSANVTGGKRAAGIISRAPDCTINIESCYNSGVIKADKNDTTGMAGGILAYTPSKSVKIDKCVNTGKVSCKRPAYASPITISQTSLASGVANYYLTGCVSGTVTHGTAKAQGELTTMLNGMTFAVNGDSYYLKTAVEAAAKYIQSDYTTDSWSAFATALTNAKNTLNNNKSTQQQMNTAQSNLEDKTEKLVPKALVTEALAPAKKAYEAIDDSEYTGASYLAITQAVTRAEALAATEGALQSDFDKAVAAIYTAIENLEKLGNINGGIDVDANGDWTLPELRPTATTPPATSATTTEATTTAATTTAATTAPEKKGCGGIIGGTIVVLTAVAAIGAGISLRKKED